MTAISPDGLRAAVRNLALPSWFAFVLVWRPPTQPFLFAVDGFLYRRAALAWLEGHNPWEEAAFGVHFAPGPHSLPFYVPFALLPEQLALGALVMISAVGATKLLWMLNLPLWWLLFPPLAQTIWTANPQPIVVCLLLARVPSARVLAIALKLYAVVPPLILGQWRPLAFTAVGLAVTFPFLPWRMYIDAGAGIEAGLHETWNGSAWFRPEFLLAPTVIALVIVGRRKAAWWAIPALWPGTQVFYSIFSLPALGGVHWAAALLAIPERGLPPLTLIVVALWTIWQRRQARTAPRA